MALHDAELIQRTLEGDESAFGFLVDKYKGSVHALAYRKLGNFHTAEEITQDTFLKAYQKLSTLKDPGRFPGWLYVIAARCCISWFRQNRVQTESLDSVKREMDTQSWTKYTDARLREEVHNALESLPESERTVLTLYYMAGMTSEEIGRFIGTSCGAIRDRLYRARMHLKEELTMIEETLGGFQLPPTLTQEIMRRIPNGPLNAAPTTGKPLVPWIVATSLVVVTLLIGLGIKQATTFQLPYSFDAPESATMVEIVDAPIINMPLLTFSPVSRTGGISGGESGNGNRENDSVQGTAADSRNSIESDKVDWTQTRGPYGGTIISLHATPEGILFAGTNEGGIFRSTDGGDTWVSASEGLRGSSDNSFPSLLVLTQEGNTLYAGTNGGLFYSINGGDSWQQLSHFQDEIVGISGIAFIGDTIYIGRHIEESVFFSNDNGKSWSQIDSGLTGRGGPKLFAIGTTLFAQMWHHVFRLKAGENSWTKLAIEDLWKKNTAESDITNLVISGEVIYAATAGGGLFRSTNMGNWWQSIRHEAMYDFDGELAALGTTIFYIGDDRVFHSTDAGNSWTMYNSNLTNQEILSMTVLSEKILYVGTLDGVFRSTDGGESWTKTNTGIINTHIEDLVFFRNTLYTITDDSVVESADGGNSWVPMNEGLVASDGGLLAVSGEKLYIATNETNYGLNPSTSGIYFLADDGNSWIPIQTNMQSANNRIYVVNQLAISGATFYIVGQMGGKEWLYRWRVGEDLWTQLMPQQDLFGWGALAVSGRTVYISTVRGKLFRSFDEGDTWTEVSQKLPNWNQEIGTYDLAFIGETIYAKAGSGGGRSTDGGETWTPLIVDGLPGGYIEMQLVDGTTLYGTSSHGVFRLTHESDSWEQIAPTQRDVTSLAFDGTTFYIGTHAEGIFRLSLDE
ncbi:hypothetical protein C6502_20340 [Candidatus Poribacteria bacterium]|nr:MAG: hypothetical protein C6502_20340 [Candidatus Poribacteria bacterium]